MFHLKKIKKLKLDFNQRKTVFFCFLLLNLQKVLQMEVELNLVHPEFNGENYFKSWISLKLIDNHVGQDKRKKERNSSYLHHSEFGFIQKHLGQISRRSNCRKVIMNDSDDLKHCFSFLIVISYPENFYPYSEISINQFTGHFTYFFSAIK